MVASLNLCLESTLRRGSNCAPLKIFYVFLGIKFYGSFVVVVEYGKGRIVRDSQPEDVDFSRKEVRADSNTKGFLNWKRHRGRSSASLNLRYVSRIDCRKVIRKRIIWRAGSAKMHSTSRRWGGIFCTYFRIWHIRN